MKSQKQTFDQNPEPQIISPSLVRKWAAEIENATSSPQNNSPRSGSSSSNYENLEVKSDKRIGKLKSPTPLAKITESVAQKSFDDNRASSRSRFRPLTSRPVLKSSKKFGFETESNSDSELPKIFPVKTWRTASPKPIIVNKSTRTQKLALDGPGSNRNADSDSGSPRRPKTVGFKPMVPLRVVTPTFEDAVKLPKRNRSAAQKKDIAISLQHPTEEVKEGIESRPRSRNYSTMNRPATQGQTEVFFRRSDGQNSARLNSAILSQAKRSSGNFEQLAGSGPVSPKDLKNELGPGETVLYSSLTDLQGLRDDSPQSSYSPDTSWRPQIRSPDYNLLLKKVEQSTNRKQEQSPNQSKANGKVAQVKDIPKPRMCLKLQYLVMQERISGCSPLISSEEKLVDFFISPQNGDHALLMSKVKINKDDNNKTFFSYQVSFSSFF